MLSVTSFASGDNFGNVVTRWSFTVEALNTRRLQGFKFRKVLCLCGSAGSYVADFFAEVLSELLRSQESSYNVRDSIRQHYLARAKICSKLIKYPHIEDYTVRHRAFGLDLWV